MKKISLFLIFVVISIVYFNENAITTYAEQFSKGFLKEGEIYKSGDIINIEEVDDVVMKNGEYEYHLCNYYGNVTDKCKFRYIIRYYQRKENCTNQYGCTTQLDYSYSMDNKIEILQHENKDVYWKVTSVNNSSYYLESTIAVELIDYTEPTLSLSCADKKIDANKSTTCDLILNYNYDAKQLDFKLNVNNDVFDVNEIKGQNNWKISDTDGAYTLSNQKETTVDKKKLTKVKVATIKLTAKDVEKSTDLKDNIVVNDIKYTDVMTSRSMNNCLETINVNKVVKEEPKEESKEEPKVEPKEEVEEVKEEVVEEQQEVVENPPTGFKNIVGIVFGATILGIVLIKISKKYKLFS